MQSGSQACFASPFNSVGLRSGFLHCQYFAGRCPIAGATDASGAVEMFQGKSKCFVQVYDSRCCLIRNHDGARMFCQQLGGANLVVPRKTPGTVRSELNVVGRVSIDEMASVNVK